MQDKSRCAHGKEQELTLSQAALSGVSSHGILIFGMHRSGTSALAGSFQEAGLYLGRTLDTPFEHNPKGLQEPPAVIFMHENLLQENGGAWHAPPPSIVWGQLHKAVRDLFIESRAPHALWGLKEPRMLLVAEGWIEALPSWSGVGIFRDPVQVAQSIFLRNGFDHDKCFAIWKAYNSALIALHRKYGVPIVEFSSDSAEMEGRIRKLLVHAGLPADQAMTFFDPAIPRHREEAAELALPQDVARLLAELRDVAW